MLITLHPPLHSTAGIVLARSLTYADGHQDFFDLQTDDKKRIPIEIDMEDASVGALDLQACWGCQAVREVEGA